MKRLPSPVVRRSLSLPCFHASADGISDRPSSVQTLISPLRGADTASGAAADAEDLHLCAGAGAVAGAAFAAAV